MPTTKGKGPEELCALCGLQSIVLILDNDRAFCCHGCRAVFHLMTSKGITDRFQEHPLFEHALETGLLSNPKLMEELALKKEKRSGEKHALILEIGDMWCQSCAEVISWSLLLQEGIFSAKVDYLTDLAAIDFSPLQVSEKEIVQKIERLGYKVVQDEGDRASPLLHLRFYVAAFLGLNIMMFSYPIYASFFSRDVETLSTWMAWLSLLFSIPLMTWVLWPIWQRGIQALFLGIIGMEALVLLSTSGAFILSTRNLIMGSDAIYFDSLATLITLIFLGKLFENSAKSSSKKQMHLLSRSIPEKTRGPDGKMRLLKEVKIGDTLLVSKGEMVPVNGQILEGEGFVDTAALTGEPAPLFKEADSFLASGSLVLEGSFLFKVLQLPEKSMPRLLSSLCLDALEQKFQNNKRWDRWLPYFVPATLLLALIGGLVGGIDPFLATLMIACPCAIAVAVPLIEMRLITLLSEKGIFIRNRDALSLLANVDRFIFDKTGTLTEGSLRIVSGLETLNPEELSLLKGLARHSIHPLCKSITETIKEEPLPLCHVQEHVGRGLFTEDLILGSRRFLQEKGIILPDSEADNTEVLFAKSNTLLSILRFEDPPKKGISTLIKEVAKPTLLSGDVESRVKEMGFPLYFAAKDPLEKREIIANFQRIGEVVAYIGDGMNDAPSLAKADVGIAMGSVSSMSQFTADLWVTGGDLSSILELIDLARRGKWLIAQNLFFAWIFNIVGLALAVTGLMSPLFAAGAMTTSSLLVVMNAFRIRSTICRLYSKQPHL